MIFLQSSPASSTAPVHAPSPTLELDREHARAQRHSLRRFVRRALLALVVLALVAAAAFSLRTRPVPADIAQLTRGPLVVTIQESGMTRVKDRYLVSAPVTGDLLRISLEPNDVIKEGEVLAKIASAHSPLLDQRTRSETEARLAAARSALLQSQAQANRATAANELARRDLERARNLAHSNAISRKELEQAEFEERMRADELASIVFAGKVAAGEVRRAEAVLARDSARSPRERHVDVLAPVSGRVLRIHHKSAGIVQAGSDLLEIGDPTALEIVVDLLTTDAVNVRPGTPVSIEGWGGDKALSGRVRQVELAAFTRPSALGIDEQRVNVIIVLTDPHEQWTTLGDGYRVEAKLVLWEGRDVLKAPQGAIFRHGNNWVVFRVEDGIARLTPIQVGHRGETEVEIVSGLSANSAVIVHPRDRIKDGVAVEAR